MTNKKDPSFGKAAGAPPSWFARIPTAAIHDLQLTHAQLRVLCAICTYANNQGFAWPNQSTIIDDIGVSQNTIDRALKTLKKKKYLTIVSRHRSHPKWKHVMGNVYRIMFDDRLATDKLIDQMNNELGPDDIDMALQVPIHSTEDLGPDDLGKPPEEEGNHTVKVSPEQLVEATEVAHWYERAAEQSHGVRYLADTRTVDLVLKLLIEGWSVTELKLEATKKLASLRAAGQPAPHHLAHAMRGVNP